MKYIICYDIKEDKIRSRVVKYLEGLAFRLQYSVFSCDCSASEIKEIQQELLKLTHEAKRPLLLIVPVCRTCAKNIWMHGKPLEEDKTYLLV